MGYALSLARAWGVAWRPVAERGCESSKFLPYRISTLLRHPHYITKLAEGRGIYCVHLQISMN